MLPELTLDTTTFARLVERARARIPAVSGRAWTDHNAHDPGITLIELYAYLLEQRVFWLDQITPALERALLALLGIKPLRSRAAQVVLAMLPTHSAHGALAAGAKIPLKDSALTFTTDETVAVVAHDPKRFELVASVSGARRRGSDLRNRRAIVVFPTDGRPAHLDLHCFLRAPWIERDEPISLLVEVTGPIPPQWDPEASDAPPPVTLELYARDAGGLRRLVGAEDGTCGLRRSGVIRVNPGAWMPEADGSHLIRIATTAAAWSVPVRLARITLNAVPARHRVYSHRSVVAPWPKLPGRTIELGNPNGAALSGEVLVAIRERGNGDWRTWREVADLTPETAGARVFVLDGNVLRFGDGIAGRQPVLGQAGEGVRVDYLAGGGVEGNIRPDREFVLADHRVWNPVAGVGGRADESLAAARERAAESLRRVTRAVTSADIVDIVHATPGVAVGRAIAVPGLDEERVLRVPGYITVYVIPFAPRKETPSAFLEPVSVGWPMPDPGLLEAVRNQLESARLLGNEFSVRPPRWIEVRLRLTVRSRTPDQERAEAEIRSALENYLDPLIGGDETSGWPLGQPIDPSALRRRVQSAVKSVAEIEELGVQVGSGPTESCLPVEIGRCHLPRLLETHIEFQRPENAGGLK